MSRSDPVYLQISDAFVFVDVSPLSLLKYTLSLFLSIPFHPPFFISVPQTRHYLRSTAKKNFEVDSQVFIYLHKYAFMYCFPVGNSTPAVQKEYHQAGIIFLFLQEQPQKEENESLRVQFTSEDTGLCASVFVPSPVHTLALSAACRRGDER